MRFSFGENWKRYARHVGEAELEEACRSVGELLGERVLQGARVLDVGSGSGLFSLAMAKLGASEVIALDVDPASAEAACGLIERIGHDEPVKPITGSILDRALMEQLGVFDVVYAWGSLHHTGALWPALGAAAGRVAPDGHFAVALYNRTWASGPWRGVKMLYNAVPSPMQLAMTAGWFSARALVRAARGKTVLRVERGMQLWTDARDWLGGYPYEAAYPDEVGAYLGRMDFVPVRERMTRTLGCNEFVFRRRQVARR